MAIRRVAIIGAGPAGAIAVDAFQKEQAFDVIRVFERREKAGGCWLYDDAPPKENQNFDFESLANRTADRKPVAIPPRLPAFTPRTDAVRYSETASYGYLETNVDANVMSYSQEVIPEIRSEISIKIHGPKTPFRAGKVVQKWVEGLVQRDGYEDFVSYKTTVELAEKVNGEWRLVLRKQGAVRDYWWTETFDAVVVATGHYFVPYFPSIPGLAEYASANPGAVDHTKYFRDPTRYTNKRVLIVGSSVSAADTATDIISAGVQTPLNIVSRGKFNGYFGDGAFRHPSISLRPDIVRIVGRDVHFKDGSVLENVEAILFGTGFNWTLPFLPNVEIRNNRIPGLYQHVFHNSDETLAFVGAVGAGLTFRVFEWQAVLAARVFAGRATLPPKAEREEWETKRIAYKGDGVPFTMIFPDFQDYFETVRKIAGEDGPGRKLPVFDPKWKDDFMVGHELRKKMWARNNEAARKALESGKVASGVTLRSKL